MFEVEWSGSYPTLCFGCWTIIKNGKNVSDAIPEDLISAPMDTFGIYQTWYFENWEEEWNSYESGLECQDWIKENPWINAICDTEEEKIELYNAISVCDWRHNSCGGCI